ncbi:quinone oxidoreductase family protein [Halobacillus litoralis]|uniref:Quinone oxidoreductase n=1 Tax=Halobacillus litoralis TaxID=45668 RepID=A0A410M9J9_9BACI|nr:zinc-binding dehydrogenase [Halobacillus litoralis]QAS51409.1 quinone oxidoreductase [Halobacillus litoralis]
MKAVISDYSKDKDRYVRLSDVQPPLQKANEVLIKVESVSLNFADVSAIRGDYHSLGGVHFIPGFDCAGTVIQVGDDVKTFSIGDRGAGFPNGGGMAEYVRVNGDLVYRLPDDVAFDDAAAILSIGITAFELVHKVAEVKENDKVLVHAAAGGVGLTLIQLLKRKKAVIYGTVGNEEKRKLINNYGVTQAIPYRTSDFEKEIMSLTNGTGVNIVFDSVGGEILEKSLNCVAPYGKLITYGHASGQPGKVLSTDLHSTSRSVIGYSSGQRQHDSPEILRASAEKVIRLLSNKELDVKISHKLSFEHANEAFQLMADRNNIGKIVITI